MEIGKYILTLDQGTTSSRAIVFDSFGAICGMGQKEFTQIYPQPGYVEHDPAEIMETTLFAMRTAVAEAGITSADITAISITNQRETTVAWDRETGRPIYNAIVWQCRRTAPVCEELKAKGMEEYIRNTTGLIIDPYFSGTKMKWIMDNVPEASRLAEKGRLCFGTIDTWLIFSLTGGQSFVTDVTNASRTMLFDIHALKWDEKMLKELSVPPGSLPEVIASDDVAGVTNVLGEEISIAGIAGDQHAALFGQCCFESGMVKNTYGTGCFVLMNTGDKAIRSAHGLITTIGWKIGDKVTYALEGSAFNAGSAIQWLRDELKIIKSAPECDVLAETVENSGGVAFVPAFTGLGAPYWDMYARGALLGITRGTTRAHVCRAVLESIALESYDLVALMESETAMQIPELRVDGGASKSRFLMQYQSDILNVKVKRPACLETTALGSAMMAGLKFGVWDNLEELKTVWRCAADFIPDCDVDTRKKDIDRWHMAVEKSRGWGR